MLRKLISVVFFGLLLSSVQGQVFPVHSQYLMDNPILISPAWAGVAECFQANLSHRTQWQNIDDAPSTQTLALNGSPFRNVGLGMILWNDKNGLYSQFRGQFTFAYHIMLGGGDKHQLNFALSGIAQQHSLAEDQFTPGLGDLDPVVDYSRKGVFSVNFNFGAAYLRDNFFISANIQDLIPKTVENNPDLLEPVNIRSYYLYGGYNWEYYEDLILVPSSMVHLEEGDGKSYWDLNFKVIKTERDYEYWGAFSVRQSINTENYELLNITPMMGFKMGKLAVSYSYDFGFTDIQRSSYGSHQISLALDFLCDVKRKNCNCDTSKKYGY